MTNFACLAKTTAICSLLQSSDNFMSWPVPDARTEPEPFHFCWKLRVPGLKKTSENSRPRKPVQ